MELIFWGQSHMIISIDKARNIPEFVGLMQDTDKK